MLSFKEFLESLPELPASDIEKVIAWENYKKEYKIKEYKKADVPVKTLSTTALILIGVAIYFLMK